MRSSVQMKWICRLLIFMLVIGIVQPMSQVTVKASGSAAATILAEVFDDQTTGAQPAGWNIPTAPAAVAPAPDPYVIRASIGELDAYSGKLLKFEKNGKSVASYSIRRNVTAVTSKVTLTYKVRAEQTNAVVYLPSLQNNTAVKFALNNGQFSYMKENASGWTPIQAYQSGEWYDIKVMLDTELGVFDFYIDDTMLLSQEPGGEGTPLSSFYLGMYKDSVGIVYFDDFLIYPYMPAASASFGQSSHELDTGEQKQLALSFEPQNATVQSAAWSSSNPAVASVTATGMVTGISAGSALITAQPLDQLPAVTTSVYVKEAVRVKGDVLAESFDAAASGQAPPNWSIPTKPAAVPPVPNPFILQATVEELPNETGKSLKFTKNAQTTASYSITRAVSTTSTKAVVTYRIKADQTGAVIYLPSLNNGSQVKFALNAGQFAYMKEGGTGWTNIQPYATGEWYEVKIMLDGDAGEFDFYINGQLKLSREPGGSGGPITSFYLGIFKDSIGTVYFDDFNVYSYKSAVSVSFAQDNYDVAKGSKVQLPLFFEPLDATVQSAIWTSSDESVASVSSSGIVTGLQTGTTIITAQPLENVAPVSVEVSVYFVPITEITLESIGSEVPVGSRVFLKAEVLPTGSTDQRVYWGSEDETIATVDRYGELAGVSPGVTTVYAVSSDGAIRGEISVTVAARNVQHDIFVSPSGSDSQAGTESAPFQTIARAQVQVREWNQQMSGDIIVNLREGLYTLIDTLALEQADSGFNGHSVVYQSYPGERAVISGGERITDWFEHDAANQIFKANVGTEFQTRQLFVGGVRAIRARSEGGLLMPVQTATGYTSGDSALAGWRNPSDLEFVYQEKWTNSRAGVAAVNAVDGKAHIAMKQPAWTAITVRGLTSATVPVYYENAYELLDQPGEWYYDRSEGMLYYKPRAWEDMATAEVIAPKLERLMTIQGESVELPVRNVQFKQLSWMYSTWMRPSTDAGHSDAQNNHLRYSGSPDMLADAAIEIELANSISFVGNEFAKLGITAIRMQNGVQNSLMEGNHFYDLSGSAVNVGSPDSTIQDVFNPADHRLVMKNNDILNNVIHDIGIDYKSSSAISAGYPVDMDISHNEMYSLPYSGTHVGYGWAKDFQPVTKNVKIQNNLIYDLMGMGLRDGGAVYSLGTTGATAADKNLVSGNYIRNQMDEGAPLYTDEGSAYWKFEHNVIDLKESKDWHSAKRWAQIWAASIHDIDFVNNYTTEANATSNGYDNVFSNNQVFPEANWPAEAQAIIEEAGLQTDFSAVAAEEVRRLNIKPVNLALGESDIVALRGYDGKDRMQAVNAEQIFFASSNSAVAVVSQQGVVTAIAKGQAKLTVNIVTGSMMRTLETDIFVGDELTEVGIEGTAGKVAFLTEGTSQALIAFGLTAYGNRIELEDVDYTSSNPNVASISAEGFITAHQAGDIVLTLRGRFVGTEAESRYLLRVAGENTEHHYGLNREINDVDGWYVNPTAVNQVQSDESSITVATPSGGHAIYQGRKFSNELIDFDLSINGTGSWYALMLGKQSETASYVNDDNYIVVISASGIELHRYNNGKRTVIYGNLAGFASIGGDAIPNTMLPFNESHRVQLGSFNQANGVRLLMKVDGETVFDFVDTSSSALRLPGYVGLLARSGSMTIAKPDQTAIPAALLIEGPATLDAGESGELTVSLMYDNGELQPLSFAEAAFSSGNESVATVGSDGILHAQSAGTSVITVSYGGISAKYAIVVHEDVVVPEGLSFGIKL
ncbi:Ig-like domain-containing protein [Paenibacillus sinopodophylli]|uniref:Ig-like domain-containing protein n=1 Tax=Paenibacillus sinopodophylli TaxID=1837342 RepID=UPI001486B621|nr:Ig-like domain-containing protein [Paenibacillus sinopodophylli]